MKKAVFLILLPIILLLSCRETQQDTLAGPDGDALTYVLLDEDNNFALEIALKDTGLVDLQLNSEQTKVLNAYFFSLFPKIKFEIIASFQGFIYKSPGAPTAAIAILAKGRVLGKNREVRMVPMAVEFIFRPKAAGDSAREEIPGALYRGAYHSCNGAVCNHCSFLFAPGHLLQGLWVRSQGTLIIGCTCPSEETMQQGPGGVMCNHQITIEKKMNLR